jgi:hypothetical protein
VALFPPKKERGKKPDHLNIRDCMVSRTMKEQKMYLFRNKLDRKMWEIYEGLESTRE